MYGRTGFDLLKLRVLHGALSCCSAKAPQTCILYSLNVRQNPIIVTIGMLTLAHRSFDPSPELLLRAHD